MCGICGVFNIDGRPVERKLIERMNQTLIHRGPDDEGFYCKGAVGLGHRRLSIIDLSSGKQPIYNEDHSKVIVFNGEVYNFQELRGLLEATGHRFRTKTDTEVLLHGYEEWGESCVERFRGMFAFAIWDESNQTLFLARDRLGIKPLYYFFNGQKIIFASEIKAILENLAVDKTINLEALSDYLSFGYIPAPKTIFKSIQKLPAGYSLACRDNRIRLKQYWDVEFRDHIRWQEDVAADRILEELEQAVKIRLICDVPLGAFLSGGIDSSVVVALMAGLSEDPVITNTVGFSVAEFSELSDAKKTADFFRTCHQEYTVAPDALDVIDKLSWYYDEPFADSSSIPTYYVSKMARKRVTVALSGDGGDENFAGYRRYYYDRLENRLRCMLPESFRRNLIGAVARIYPKADWLPQVFRAKTFLTNLSNDPIFGYFNTMSLFLVDMKSRVLHQDVQTQLLGYDPMDVFRYHFARCSSNDPLSRIQYVDLKTYLVDDILTKVDRASMANGLEVRVPLLDHKFVEFIAGLPANLKLKGSAAKYIFKKAASRRLPEEILKRKKMGFCMPVGKWLKHELRPLVQDTILSSTLKERGLFSPSYIDWMWRQHESGLRDFTQPLWTLLSFELWARRFL